MTPSRRVLGILIHIVTLVNLLLSGSRITLYSPLLQESHLGLLKKDLGSLVLEGPLLNKLTIHYKRSMWTPIYSSQSHDCRKIFT